MTERSIQQVQDRSDLLRHAVVAVFCSVLFVAPLVWMLMDRVPPYTFQHVEISPRDVIQGDEIHITFHVKHSNRSCASGWVYREFIDGAGKRHVFDPIPRIYAPSRDEPKFTRIARVVTALEPGPAVYRGTACYACNPLQSVLHWPVCVKTPEISFNVLPRKPTP